jgi:hypothetical protein
MSTAILVSNKRSLKELLTAQLAVDDAQLGPDGLDAVIDFVEIQGPTWVDRGSFAGMPDQTSSGFPARGVSHAMLDAVRDVALYAAGGDVDAARLVSKGEWDDAREGAGFPDLPTAESMRQRLRMTHWRSVLAVVFLPAEHRRQAIGTYTKRVGAFGRGTQLPTLVATPVEWERIEQLLAENDIGEALGASPPEDPPGGARELPKGATGVVVAITTRALMTVAFRVGRTPSAQEYDHEVRVLEDDRRRAGLPPLGFPTSDSVIRRFGAWAQACSACELEPPAAYVQAPGAPLIEVIDASIDLWGVVCGSDKVRHFAEACDVSTQYRTDAWPVILEEVRELRAKRGARMPGRATQYEARRLPMPTAEQAAAIRERLGDFPRHRKPRRTIDAAYEGLRLYKAEHLGANDRPVTAHYMAACRKDSRLLWPSVLKTVTGKSFTQLMAEEGM